MMSDVNGIGPQSVPLRPQAADRTGRGQDAAALRAAARDFEAYFMRALLKEMRKTVPQTSSEGASGYARDLYEDMYDEALAGVLAQRGGIGLADVLVAQLSSPGK